jgi:hypothetical protein
MNTMMTTDEMNTIVEANKGELAEVLLTDGSTLTGTLISINSKGINLKVDGRVTSRSLSKIAWIAIDEGDLDEDTEADMLADMIEEGVIEVEDDDIEVAAAEDGIANLDLPGTDLDALVAELDGCTTAELADVFGIEAKALRVTLRALGMGVGKGHRYHLTNDQVTTVRAALTATA